MTPDDLPCKDGHHWEQTYFAREVRPADESHPVRLYQTGVVVIGYGVGVSCVTPAEVRAYYDARPHVPCPFRFEP